MKTGVETVNFWSKFKDGVLEECWPWTGNLDANGYGRFSGKLVHRMVYEFVNGPIPSGLLVRHKCDNPPCGNPDHLLLGTHADNSRDASERKRLPTGVRNGNGKLTDEQVNCIRANPDRKNQAELALRFGVAPSTISMIMSGTRR